MMHTDESPPCTREATRVLIAAPGIQPTHIPARSRFSHGLLATFMMLALTACVPGVGDLLDTLTGKDVQIRVLQKTRITLDAPITLDLAEPMALAGSETRVCLILAHEVQFSDVSRLREEYLRGAVPAAAIVTDSGQRIPLAGQSMHWRSRGALQRRNELSVCMHPCDTLPARGTGIRKVVVSSSQTIATQAIYLYSAPTLKERQQQRSNAKSADALEPSQEGCPGPKA